MLIADVGLLDHRLALPQLALNVAVSSFNAPVVQPRAAAPQMMDVEGLKTQAKAVRDWPIEKCVPRESASTFCRATVV